LPKERLRFVWLRCVVVSPPRSVIQVAERRAANFVLRRSGHQHFDGRRNIPFAGHYRLHGCHNGHFHPVLPGKAVGAGGGGEVFKAYHLRMEKYVAVKIIKEEVKGILHIRAEVDLLKGLNNEHIPSVSDFIEDNGILYSNSSYKERDYFFNFAWGDFTDYEQVTPLYDGYVVTESRMFEVEETNYFLGKGGKLYEYDEYLNICFETNGVAYTTSGFVATFDEDESIWMNVMR